MFKCHEIAVWAEIGSSDGKHDSLHIPDWVAVKIQVEQLKLGFQRTCQSIDRLVVTTIEWSIKYRLCSMIWVDNPLAVGIAYVLVNECDWSLPLV